MIVGMKKKVDKADNGAVYMETRDMRTEPPAKKSSFLHDPWPGPYTALGRHSSPLSPNQMITEIE
jgi:hypothetical protein